MGLSHPGLQLGPWPAYLASAGGTFAVQPVRIGLNASVGILPLAPPKYVFRAGARRPGGRRAGTGAPGDRC